MPYVTVGKENSANIDIYYEDHGSGKPIVLSHGYPLSGVAWEKQLPVLLKAGYRVITYDRRGFGKSSQPTVGYDYGTFADDLHKLVSKLELNEFVMAGHSMGSGEVAGYIAKYGTERLRKGVFISALPPFLLKAADNPNGADPGLFEGFKKAVLADRQAFEASWNIAVSASPTAAYECVTSWTTDFRKGLSRVDIPTLIIHGDADRVLPYPITAVPLSKMLKNTRLVTVEAGPHAIAWTHAEIVNRELVEFLR